MKFDNFVSGRLTAPITGQSTSLEVLTTSPFRPPPNPSGQRARLVLLDNPRRPTKIEVVGYYRTEPGMTRPPLIATIAHDLERGLDGTVAEDWPSDTFIGQDIPAAMVEVLAASCGQGQVLGFMPSGRFCYRDVHSHELVANGIPPAGILLSGIPTAPEAPESGAVLFMMLGRLYARFPTGLRVVISQ